MIIGKARQTHFLLLFGLIFFSATLIGIALQIYSKDIRIVYEPLHSSIEGIGAVAAILMALLLLHLHQDDEKRQEEYFLLSMGFLMVGILDGFHSITVLNHGFILLRSLANIFGGMWFALLWVPGAGRYVSRISSFPWIVAGGSILIGSMTISFRESLPFMLVGDNFTFVAVFMNMLAGIFSIAAGSFYLYKFVHRCTTESYLFACMFFLLGLSGIEFIVSGLWGCLWWFWHAERFLAYIVVLVYMVRLFLWNRKELKKMNEVLEERIAERTRELINEIAERTRYGIERDKVISDLNKAKIQIKTLTGLLPICASCKKIRNPNGSWEQLESYIQKHSEANFSHGLCIDCARKLYPEFISDIMSTQNLISQG